MQTIDLQRMTINAPSLKNNKLNDSIQRDVFIYLPPSYQSNTEKHYPVIYLLHGFGGTAEGWFSDELPLQKITEQLIKTSQINEMIIVVPECGTQQTCSAYLDSPIQGNWQQFICLDLVKAIESKYRCQSGWENRAIVGHSSGGDAVLQTLLLSPKVFKHGFAMSAPGVDNRSSSMLFDNFQTHKAQLQQAQQGKLAISELPIWAHIALCYLQITFPEATSPPLYCRFPETDEDWEKMRKDNLHTLYQLNKANLQSLNLALDVGLKEGFLEQSREFVKQLQNDGLAVELYEFNGGHVDHMAKSMPYVLTYISDSFAKEQVTKNNSEKKSPVMS